MFMICRLASLVCLVAPSALAKPLGLDTVRKWSWGENVGFMNWREVGSPAGSQGSLLYPDILSGFV
jgi:hypothetical protein